MKICKRCQQAMPVWSTGRVYCSRTCANYARHEQKRQYNARLQRDGEYSNRPPCDRQDAKTEVAKAEEALRVLRLEMEADRGTARPREASLAAADALERGEGPHLAELREYGLTGRAMAIIQTGGGLPR